MIMKQHALLVGLAIAVVGVTACTEPRAAAKASAPAPALEARLELSDSAPHAGESLSVRLRLSGPNAAKIVSFTGRLTFDSASLRFVSESAISDGATRVSNPTAGLIRAASVSATGFSGGLLAEYHFIVSNPQGVNRFVLGIDELHDASHIDAAKTVVIRRGVGLSIP
jgi:hypothetical protein